MTGYQAKYRIGVDVGGTNTDAALVCNEAPSTATKSKPKLTVVASSKSETTADVTSGICNAIRNVLRQAPVPTQDILSVNVGTTHFVNAVTQVDTSKLRRVAVLRLCGPFGRQVEPFADWPRALSRALQGPVGYLAGGLDLDGRVIAPVSESEVQQYAQIIKDANVTAVAIVGVFSNLDPGKPTQEEYVKQLLLQHTPGLNIVCSRDVGFAPFIERENATILNASILDFGRKTIRSFERAFRSLELDCELYLTQNDGTVMDTEAAARLPIKTFSSGATNSLTGAMFLADIQGEHATIDPKTSQIIMVDIGGTTSDFAALAPSGFPRQSPATVKVGGVRTAFRLPELVSIGLGGGSHVVQHEDGRVTVGPTSVGYQLPVLSKCFGGDVLTASDIVAASGVATELVPTTLVDVASDVVEKARRNIKRQFERNIGQMRVSDQEVVLLLVGGGSIIQLDDIENVRECIRPPFYDVANAVGAAIAKISGEVDVIEVPGDRKTEDIVEDLKKRAIEVTCVNGAVRESIKIAEVDVIPIQYTTSKEVRVVIRASGELSWEGTGGRKVSATSDGVDQEHEMAPQPITPQTVGIEPAADDVYIASYIPEVSRAMGEWFLSETDLRFIAEGCGILGTGGGGSVYGTFLECTAIMRRSPKGRMRIIDQPAIKDDARVAIVSGVGAPTVSNERLRGSREFRLACEGLLQYTQLPSFAGLASGEIGGANGMCPIAVGGLIDVPIIDADLMGRAYPRVDMSLPFVYEVEPPYPVTVADPRGISQVISRVDTPERLERLLRSTAIELGLSCAVASSISANSVRNCTIHRTVSLAWYIGRSVLLARQERRDIIESLCNTIPGCKSIFIGRIIDVSREVRGGWTFGTAKIEQTNEDDEEGDQTRTPDTDQQMLLQYQNEFCYAGMLKPDGSRKTVCTTPDLITVIDTAGTAIGTHELRYGLMVTVITMPAHPLWTTPQGLKAAAPAAFGLTDVEYTPSQGVQWRVTPSVIEEFGR